MCFMIIKNISDVIYFRDLIFDINHSDTKNIYLDKSATYSEDLMILSTPCICLFESFDNCISYYIYGNAVIPDTIDYMIWMNCKMCSREEWFDKLEEYDPRAATYLLFHLDLLK